MGSVDNMKLKIGDLVEPEETYAQRLAHMEQRHG